MSWNGLFSKPVYTTLGDPYVQRKEPPPRGVGGELRPMVTRGSRTGLEAGFGPVKPLYEGEQYLEPGLARRRARKNNIPYITDKPFKASSPQKKHATPGDGHGTFGGVPEASKPTLRSPARRRAEGNEGEPKNFITSPGKRGGHGVAGTLFAEYEYVPQREGAKKRKEKAEGEEEAKPFVPARRGGGLLHGYASTGAPAFLGADDRCLPPPPDPNAALTRKEIAALRVLEARAMKDPEEDKKPFVPSHVPRAGHVGAFGSFDHADDPYDPLAVRRAQATLRNLPRKLRTASLPERYQEQPEFKPSSTPKHGLTRSTALPRVVNPSKLAALAASRRK